MFSTEAVLAVLHETHYDGMATESLSTIAGRIAALEPAAAGSGGGPADPVAEILCRVVPDDEMAKALRAHATAHPDHRIGALMAEAATRLAEYTDAINSVLDESAPLSKADEAAVMSAWLMLHSWKEGHRDDEFAKQRLQWLARRVRARAGLAEQEHAR